MHPPAPRPRRRSHWGVPRCIRARAPLPETLLRLRELPLLAAVALALALLRVLALALALLLALALDLALALAFVGRANMGEVTVVPLMVRGLRAAVSVIAASARCRALHVHGSDYDPDRSSPINVNTVIGRTRERISPGDTRHGNN